MVPLYNNQFDGYARLLRITQRIGYGLMNPRVMVPFTGEDVRYNAWLTIAVPAG